MAGTPCITALQLTSTCDELRDERHYYQILVVVLDFKADDLGHDDVDGLARHEDLSEGGFVGLANGVVLAKLHQCQSNVVSNLDLHYYTIRNITRLFSFCNMLVFFACSTRKFSFGNRS